MHTSNRVHVKTLIPYPCRCAQCARIQGPAFRTYNYLEGSQQQVCMTCYSELAGTGIFDPFINQEVK